MIIAAIVFVSLIFVGMFSVYVMESRENGTDR